jgi:lipopolysaccharide transport system permease protein
MSKPLTVISSQSATQRAKLGELWRYRELAWNMTLRDIKVRYKQTVLGVAWAVLQPIVTMIIFTFIFGGLAKIPSEGFPYPVFVYSGLLAWNLFATSVSSSGGSMVSAANMIGKVYFPRLIIPLAAMGVATIDFMVSFCVLLVLMAIFSVMPSSQIVLFPFFLIGLLFAAVGMGTWLAAVTVSYRDFRFVIPFMIQTWMYITPVIYPASFIPEAYRWLVYLNPIFGWISGAKAAILGTPIDWLAVGCSFAWTIVLLWLGVSYFNRAERRFADII